ncbi:hypothetical protein [Polaromonas sp.]|uniref:hypothetical protein n=1 Tax=Polaromonas sp. TaxID=1869339 RepID=UPI0013BC047E|nr:hypothetical protein [Polaromonas sp.]NDP61795.1 hypothetical protein [Polaromonas sp.]
MTLKFSSAAMKAMGYKEFTEAEAISASFSSITIYQVKGISLEANSTEISSGTIARVDYRLAISSSINAACTALLQDNFTDDEEKWKIDSNCQGPFVLIQIGPTPEHKCANGHIAVEKDGSIITYDCFPTVRAELAELESRVLPPIISALTCVFNVDTHYVVFKKITSLFTGKTSSGILVRDTRIEFRAEGLVSYKQANQQVAEKLDLVKNLASTLNPKASRFFSLGLSEIDQLKKFLYFFLELEIETHAAFGRINHETEIKKLLDKNGLPITKLIQIQLTGLKNIYDKFIWCATCEWPEISDSDITEFKLLKKERDNIAHGSTSEPPPGFALRAEKLAHKILWLAKN